MGFKSSMKDKLCTSIAMLLLAMLAASNSLSVHNSTHFSCDDGKLFPNSHLNDNYCDCTDGTDETNSNACQGGKFYCKNRFFIPRIIHSYLVNDGVCDCCDGSDEFSSLNCEKICVSSSITLLAQLKSDFKELKNIARTLNRDKVQDYYDEWKSLIEKYIYSFAILNELYSKRKLVVSYLHILERKSQLNQGDKQAFKDENFGVLELQNLLKSISAKIELEQGFVNENREHIEKLLLLKNNQEFNQQCIKGYFRQLHCEVCLDKGIQCEKYKKNRTIKRSLGHLVKIEENRMIFEGGSDCRSYNKTYSANVKLVCSAKEEITLEKIKNVCLYKLIYKAPHHCNNTLINHIKQQISQVLSHV